MNENRKEVWEAYRRYEQKIEDLYEEMIWDLSMDLNIPEDVVRGILDGDMA